MADWSTIGYITKTHGYKGNLIIKTIDESYDRLLQNKEAIYLEISGRAVPHFTERTAIQKPKQILVKFEDIETEELAKAFIKTPVLIEANALEEEDSLEGYMIVNADTKEHVGPVDYIMDIPNNPLAVILIDHEEIYIPINDSLIVEINDTDKTIWVHISEGVIEVNL